MLGEIITRPKLSEKLLSKPPFRFLFDIVLEVIKVSGFASTLYTPEETDSANVTEKAQKLSFLEKIIRLVGVQLNTMIEAKPLRIIGGYDHQNTNNFLQLLSIAAKHMPDSRNAVFTVLEQDASGPAGESIPSILIFYISYFSYSFPFLSFSNFSSVVLICILVYTFICETLSPFLSVLLPRTLLRVFLTHSSIPSELLYHSQLQHNSFFGTLFICI